MIDISPRSSTVPVYVNTDACIAIYRNTEATVTIPSTAVISTTVIREINVVPLHPLTVFKTDNYSISLVHNPAVGRFLFNSTPALINPSLIDNLNIFTVYKELAFYVVSDYDSAPIPLTLKLDLFDISSVKAIESVLKHPDVQQVYVRTDTGHKVTTFEMLQSVKNRNKVNLGLELKLDFRYDSSNVPLLNLQFKERGGQLTKISTAIDTSTASSVSYRGNFYRKVSKLSDLSETGYYFADEQAVYITEWGNN